MDKQVIAGVLERAAELIEVHGHYKGGFGDASKGFCANGAIRRAAFESAQNARQMTAVFHDATNALRFKVFGSEARGWSLPVLLAESVPMWNDEPERTAGEVVDTIRRAAKDLRNEA